MHKPAYTFSNRMKFPKTIRCQGRFGPHIGRSHRKTFATFLCAITTIPSAVATTPLRLTPPLENSQSNEKKCAITTIPSAAATTPLRLTLPLENSQSNEQNEEGKTQEEQTSNPLLDNFNKRENWPLINIYSANEYSDNRNHKNNTNTLIFPNNSADFSNTELPKEDIGITPQKRKRDSTPEQSRKKVATQTQTSSPLRKNGLLYPKEGPRNSAGGQNRNSAFAANTAEQFERLGDAISAPPLQEETPPAKPQLTISINLCKRTGYSAPPIASLPSSPRNDTPKPPVDPKRDKNPQPTTNRQKKAKAKHESFTKQFKRECLLAAIQLTSNSIAPLFSRTPPKLCNTANAFIAVALGYRKTAAKIKIPGSLNAVEFEQRLGEMQTSCKAGEDFLELAKGVFRNDARLQEQARTTLPRDGHRLSSGERFCDAQKIPSNFMNFLEQAHYLPPNAHDDFHTISQKLNSLKKSLPHNIGLCQAYYRELANLLNFNAAERAIIEEPFSKMETNIAYYDAKRKSSICIHWSKMQYQTMIHLFKRATNALRTAAEARSNLFAENIKTGDKPLEFTVHIFPEEHASTT